MDVGISMRSRGLKPVAELAATKPHGHRVRYMAGCRCLKCRMANANYALRRIQACNRGEGNAIVDASPAIAHLRELSRQGVGYKTAADAASVARSTVSKLVFGERTRARAQTVRRLLAVTAKARADHSTVRGGKTWRMINQLLEEGFTKARISRELGNKTPALQIRHHSVLARTELAVERLWRKYMQ